MTRDTILLVEDSIDDADLTIRAFKRANIDNPVVVAEDGALALDYLDAALSPRNQPRLMVLDLKLPKVSGLEVLRRIRSQEHTRFLPVVILTTSAAQEDIVNSYALGANAYVRKPVAFEDFIAAASRLGLFWLDTNLAAPPGVRPTPAASGGPA
jgi:two-component system response regulator